MDCQSELQLNRGQQSKGYLGFSRENDAHWKDWGLWVGYSDSVPECRAAAWASSAAGNSHSSARNHRKMHKMGFGRAAAGASQGSSALLWREEEIIPRCFSNMNWLPTFDF